MLEWQTALVRNLTKHHGFKYRTRQHVTQGLKTGTCRFLDKEPEAQIGERGFELAILQ